MSPVRRRSALRPAPSPTLVSYQDSVPGPSTLRLLKGQNEVIAQLQGLRAQNGLMQLEKATTSMSTFQTQIHTGPVPSVSIIPPAATAHKSVEVPPPTVPVTLTQPTLNRRSGRVPKRKRRSSSPELRQPLPPLAKLTINPHSSLSNGHDNPGSKSPPSNGFQTPEGHGAGGTPQSLPSTLPLPGVNGTISTKSDSSTAPITPDYFKDKNEFGAAIMILLDSTPVGGYDKLPFTGGWLKCGICCNISEIVENVAQAKKYGAYLCGKCIPFLNKMLKIAKRAEALDCSGGGGCCPFPVENEGSKGVEPCEACFVHHALLVLELDDTIYFKLWRAVPPVARTNVPPAPPKVKRYPESRGRVLYVDKGSGSILHVASGVSATGNKSGGGGTAAGGKNGKKRVAESVSSKKVKDNEMKTETVASVEGQGAAAAAAGGRSRRITRAKKVAAEPEPVTQTQLPETVNKQSKVETDNSKTEDTVEDDIERPMPMDVTPPPESDDVKVEKQDEAVVNIKPDTEPEPEPEKVIRVVPSSSSNNSPSDLDESVVEKHGYPVIVVAGQEPPTPLCFSCGSAGINQLVYCCSCSQPFHPYCSDDELLLAAYLAQINHSVSATTTPTPAPDLAHKFRKWKCSRCLTCSRCGCGGENGDEFVGCSLCASSFHLRCAKKMPLKPGERDRDKWVCANCLKCTSCLIPLTKSSHHLRKLGAATTTSTCPEILCLECFRRRQKGAFCPVCYVCYDDNDWDSKMMECDKCQRWIHAQCEGLNDERYFILSGLPETISYVCRLCQPPVNVGWRHAVETELLDGCLRVLDLFQRKVIGVSRKRRALSFELDGSEMGRNESPLSSAAAPSYFSPSLAINSSSSVGDEQAHLPLQERQKNELHSPPRNGYRANPNFDPIVPSLAEDLKLDSARTSFCSPVKRVPLPRLSPDENLLVRQFNIRPCSIRMELPRPSQILETPSCPLTEKINPGAPIKRESQPQPVDPTPLTLTLTPVKLSTPHRVASSFAEAVRASASLWGGVRHFRAVALALLPPYFVDLTQNDKYGELGNDEAKFCSHFEETLKQVFPWWREDLKEILVNVKADSKEGTEMDLVSEDGGSSEDGLLNMNLVKDEELPDARVFEDTFWNEKVFLDSRICSLCEETGDFPLTSCGRLLHVNPESWIHVNCALWSSEVWEEESGALQQVEGALLRGKKSECDHCTRAGATLNCCAFSCRKCFHFQCALDGGCRLESDKGVFCPLHSSQAKGQIQSEMHVTRKVFVSGSGSGGGSGNGRSGQSAAAKELMLASNRLKLFIGSTRVDRLGHLVPISALSLKNRNNSLLLPVNFRVSCLRLIKSGEGEFSLKPKSRKYDVFTWNSTLDRTGDFRKSLPESGPSSYSVVIDHSKRPDLVQLRVKEAESFWTWVKNVNRFVDEFGIEWSPIYRPPSRRRKKAPDSAPFGVKNLVYRASLEWTPSPASSLEDDLLTGVLSHPRLRFLLEQLPGLEEIPGSYRFRYCDPARPLEDVPVTPTPSGSARSEPFSTRRPHDMFNWLRSQHRQPPKLSGIFVSEETAKAKGLPIAMRFRNLKERATKDLVVLPSHIHGRGLFSQRDIGVGEMLIEYAGELIRSVLCDVRERKYERAGIGCYMFRVNRDLVVDATLKGNAARFINHSCVPNCESKAVKILGKDHILIFALSNIGRGEELTYDYKFEREENKLPCACNSRKCRRFLN